MLMLLVGLLRGSASTSISTFDVAFIFSRKVNGAAFPANRFGTQCSLQELETSPCSCYGGAARRKTLTSQPGVISIDTGSHFHGGGTFFAVFRGEVQSNLFAQQNFSAWGLTYRDFLAFARGDAGAADGGAHGLAQYIARVQATDRLIPPPTATNINLLRTPLESHVVSHTILMLPGGQRAAYLSAFVGAHLGAANPVLASRLVGIKEALTRAIHRLHAMPGELPSVVVASLSGIHDAPSAADIARHGSVRAARDAILTEISNEVLGIDVLIVDGEDDDDALEWSIQTSWAGTRVLVVEGGHVVNGRAVTNVTVSFNGAGHLLSAACGEVVLDCTVPEDPSLAAQLIAHHARLDATILATVGYLAIDGPFAPAELMSTSSTSDPQDDTSWSMLDGVAALPIAVPAAPESSGGGKGSGSAELSTTTRWVRGSGCCLSTCTLGALVTDAMREAAPPADAALVNCGALKATLSAGAVSRASLIQALPYLNELVLLEIRGWQLRAALGRSLSLLGRSDVFEASTESGRFLQVGGLCVQWFFREGRAQLSPELGNISLADGTLVGANTTITIVTNAFLANGGGGDGFDSLRDAASRSNLGILVFDAVATFLAAHAPTAQQAYTPTTTGRILQLPNQETTVVETERGAEREAQRRDRNQPTRYALIATACLVAALVGTLCVYERHRRNVAMHHAKILLHDMRTGIPPVLTLPPGRRFHIFLSHTWRTGQDQVAVIKRQLSLMLTGVACFLGIHHTPLAP